MSNKCIVNITNTSLVMDTEDAIKIFKALNGADAEVVEYDYIPMRESTTGESQSLYYLKPKIAIARLETVGNEEYAMWKLYTSTRGKTNE